MDPNKGTQKVKDENEPGAAALVLRHHEKFLKVIGRSDSKGSKENRPRSKLTVECYLALRIPGNSESSQSCARARSYLSNHGVLSKTNGWTRLYLSVLGVLPWEQITKIPVEVVLIPKWWPLQIWHLSYWVNVISIPMALLGAVGPGQPMPLASQLRRELQGDGLQTEYVPAWMQYLVRVGVQVQKLFPGLRARAIQEALVFIRNFTESHGDLGGNTCTVINVLLAYHRLGLAGTGAFESGLASLLRYGVFEGNEWRVQTCQSHVWDTGFAMMALDENVVPSHAIQIAEAKERGRQWLLGRQILPEKHFPVQLGV